MTDLKLVRDTKQEEIDQVVEQRRIEKEQSRLDMRKAALAGRMIEERQGGKMVHVIMEDGTSFKGRMIKTFYDLTATMYYKISLGVYERPKFVKVRDVAEVVDL